MADAPSLGDFFKAKAKRKVKASNLNKAEEKKTEEKKVKKATEDDAWQDEEVVVQTIKVEVAGKLPREEEKKDEEDTAAPAWGNAAKSKDHQGAQPINEKKYPSLAKSVGSSTIHIDDGDFKPNIATSKNVFAALEGEDDDEDGSRKPTSIKPAMVTKKKGEREKVALQRELDKYDTKASSKKEGKKKGKEDEGDDDEDDDEDEADEEEAPAPVEEAPKKKAAEKKEDKKEDKKAKKPVQEEEAADNGEVAEDLKIQVDLKASKEKYDNRKKMPPKELPRSELEEEKENKPNKPKPEEGKSGKKKKFMVEEDDKKLLVAPDDW